ncbi:hypothetical protein [Actinomadura rubrisoli]|uniref:Holin n=1 Tax=Actinomadura rubrisoli TaxID=2530368 RepID=A0A4R5C1U3_9ACTN|nr:hypothetical protein [Actinomadura rubrisoli]TDD90764.1 hypothetical protein E1298_12750 [Actinomadura rubrisoli]
MKKLRISAYWKGVIAAAAPVLATVQAAVDDRTLDTSELVTIGAAALVALGVWKVPNKTPDDAPVRGHRM